MSGTAKSESRDFGDLALPVLEVLSCLSSWVVSHDYKIVLMTVFATLGAVVLNAPSDRTLIDVGTPVFWARIKR